MASLVDQIFGNAVGDSVLILGDVVFGYLEIPENFNFGGQQLMNVHQLVGGARIVDSLGPVEHDITWSGMFFGANASERARALDYLRTLGNQIEMIFGEFIYLVVISDFSPSFERYYQVPYSITLKVIKNLTLPVTYVLPDGYNDAVNDDLQYMLNLVGATGSAELANALDQLSSSITSAGNLANATQDQLNNITDNISNCQNINNGLINGGS